MAESMNNVSIVGRLGRDPELRQTAGGTPVANMGLAVDGRGDDDVSWIDVVLFGKSAEAAAKHLSKGRRVGVQGRLQQRRWETKDGGKRSTVEVVASAWFFLDAKPQGERESQPDMPADRPRVNPSPASGDDMPF